MAHVNQYSIWIKFRASHWPDVSTSFFGSYKQVWRNQEKFLSCLAGNVNRKKWILSAKHRRLWPFIRNTIIQIIRKTSTTEEKFKFMINKTLTDAKVKEYYAITGSSLATHIRSSLTMKVREWIEIFVNFGFVWQ